MTQPSGLETAQLSELEKAQSSGRLISLSTVRDRLRPESVDYGAANAPLLPADMILRLDAVREADVAKDVARKKSNESDPSSREKSNEDGDISRKKSNDSSSAAGKKRSASHKESSGSRKKKSSDSHKKKSSPHKKKSSGSRNKKSSRRKKEDKELACASKKEGKYLSRESLTHNTSSPPDNRRHSKRQKAGALRAGGESDGLMWLNDYISPAVSQLEPAATGSKRAICSMLPMASGGSEQRELMGGIEDCIVQIGANIVDVHSGSPAYRDLQRTQKVLMGVYLYFATPPALRHAQHPVTSEHTKQLEYWTESMAAVLPRVDGYVVPEGLHYVTYKRSRTIFRRLTPYQVFLRQCKDPELAPEVVEYLERLPDYFHTFARYFNRTRGLNDLVYLPDDPGQMAHAEQLLASVSRGGAVPGWDYSRYGAQPHHSANGSRGSHGSQHSANSSQRSANSSQHSDDGPQRSADGSRRCAGRTQRRAKLS